MPGSTITITTDRIRGSGISRQPSSWQIGGWKGAPHSPRDQPADSPGNRRRNGSQIKTQSEILPLVPYLDTLRWMFIAVALIGIAVAIHARIDDWKRGQR